MSVQNFVKGKKMVDNLTAVEFCILLVLTSLHRNSGLVTCATTSTSTFIKGSAGYSSSDQSTQDLNRRKFPTSTCTSKINVSIPLTYTDICRKFNNTYCSIHVPKLINLNFFSFYKVIITAEILLNSFVSNYIGISQPM